MSKNSSRGADIGRILRGAHRDIRDLLRLAHDQKFVVARTRNAHFSITTPPDVQPPLTVYTPSTPSDWRSVRGVRRELRRIGVDIPRT